MEKIELYIAEAFMAAGGFIDIKFFENLSENIDILQEKFFLITPDDGDWRLEPKTWDPSVWNDWMHAVYKILNKKNIDFKKDKVTPQQAYMILKEFIKAFVYEYDFKDLIELYEEINQSEKDGLYKSKQWKQWLFCVNAILKCMITRRGSLYDSYAKIFTQRQSYEIMQKFFINFCIEKQNMYVLTTLLKDDFYKDWQKVYEQVSDDKVSLVQSYNIMRIFLTQWAIKHLNDEQCEMLISQFRVDDKQIPIKYSFFYHWIRETNAVLIDI